MSKQRAAKKKRGSRESNKVVVYGEESGFHFTVRPDLDDGYSITMWKGNYGTATFPTIKDYDKALKIALFLYENLLPEVEAQEREQEKRTTRMLKELASRPKPKPPRVPKNAPKLAALICPECDKAILPEDVSDERVYECQQCGTRGSGEEGRRCDSCNKFAAKISDTSCPECGAAMDEAEKAEVQQAIGGTLVRCAA